MNSMTTKQLTELFAEWRKLNGFASFDGDAEELQTETTLTDTQRAWLANFCSAWSASQASEDGRGIEIARLQLGPADMCRVITIRQNASNLYTVRNWEVCDGERSDHRDQRFANAALALAQATRLMADEVADMIETADCSNLTTYDRHGRSVRVTVPTKEG